MYKHLNPHNFFFKLVGEGGTGKSFLIKIIAMYGEKILRLPGDHPMWPKILLLAPTGIAAYLIGNIK